SRGPAAQRSAAASAAAEASTAVERAASQLSAPATRATEIYRTTRVFPGLAVHTDASRLRALAALPGVVGVLPLTPKQRDNTRSDQLTRAVQAWRDAGNTGVGVTVGVVDTGIDYDHVDFGGAGRAAFQANNSAVVEPGTFPTRKVVAGRDFAGDAYNATTVPTPAPDDDPLDCASSRGGGHGTHVAGTVAGFGVTSAGTTYTGSYQTATDAELASLKVGPGAAPEAKLAALRVFGCGGSTSLVTQALDHVAALNTDDVASNDIDIVNMSLGSGFGGRGEDPDALAVDELTRLGVLSVISAGNAGDVFFTAGSPGTARTALTVAASDDGVDIVDGVRIETGTPSATETATTYPATNSIAYPYDTKRADNRGELVRLTTPTNLDGCAAFSATDRARVAGKYAFLEWDDDSTTRRCGSAGRGANARNAGALGAVYGSNRPRFSAGITGDTVIPITLMDKNGADATRAALAAGKTVYATFGYAFRAGSAQGARIDALEATDTIADFTSRGGTTADGYLKPDVAAPGLHTFSANSGTGDDGLDESGTSMAAPHTAGTAALVRSEHPTWSPEEVKADLVNTASGVLSDGGQGRGAEYSVTRVGAGRIDGRDAVANTVLASVVGDGGSVGLGFGPVEATGPLTRTKSVLLRNYGRTARTYAPSYDVASDVPGVTFELPDSVSVPAASGATPGTATFDVVLRISDVAALRRTPDATVDLVQAGLPRQFLAEENGRILLTPAGGGQVLRLHAAVAPRPASTVRGSDAVVPPSGVARSTGSLQLTGTGLDNGTPGAVDAVQSLVGGFQLQTSSPRLPACTGAEIDGCISRESQRAADLQYVGATSTLPLGTATPTVGIALSTYGRWGTPVYDFTEGGEFLFVVYFDTNGDGVDDRETDVTRYTTGTDVLVAETYDLVTGRFLEDQPLNSTYGLDTAALSSNAMVVPVSLKALGLPAGSTKLSYHVETYSAGDSSAALESTTPVTFDVAHPRTLVVPQLEGTLLSRDTPGALEVRTDTTDTTSPDLGVLLLHLHATEAERAQVVQVTAAAPAGPAASASPSPSASASASPSPSASETTVPAPGDPGLPPPPAPLPPAPSVSPSASPSASPSSSPSASSSASPVVTPTTAAPSPSTVSPTTAPQRPVLSLSPSTITAGQRSTLTVTGVPGSTVQVYGYTRPSTTYRLLRTLTLDASGRASSQLVPLGSTRLYALQQGSTATTAPSVVLTVRAAVSERAVRTSRLTYTLTGRVYPARAAQLVSVFRQTASGGLVLTAQARTHADGVWSVSRRFTTRGTVDLLARSARTNDVDPGTSPVVRVTLR
ncbi:MAG: peptidase, partial [Frankiales bacterium]|nr:peptidase [Frankiales bacterium]